MIDLIFDLIKNKKEAAIQSVSAYAVSIEGNNLLFNSDVFREYLTYLESRNELFFRSFIHSIANTIRRFFLCQFFIYLQF